MGLVFSTGKGSGFLPNFYLLTTALPKHSVLKSLCSHVSQKYEEIQRWGMSRACSPSARGGRVVPRCHADFTRFFLGTGRVLLSPGGKSHPHPARCSTRNPCQDGSRLRVCCSL